MQPTLRVGDYVLVEKNRYGFKMPVWHWRISAGEPPARGDIVVFRKPGDEVYFIKRIIAVPGDKLSYHGGRFYIDDARVPAHAEKQTHFYQSEGRGGSGFRRGGEVYREELPGAGGWHNILLDEKINRAEIAQPPDDQCELWRLPSGRVLNCKLPEGYYFVAGDNRDHSNDSRYWGLLPESHLVGPAVRVLFNWSHKERIGLSLSPSREAYIPTPDPADGDGGNGNRNNRDGNNGDGGVKENSGNPTPSFPRKRESIETPGDTATPPDTLDSRFRGNDGESANDGESGDDGGSYD